MKAPQTNPFAGAGTLDVALEWTLWAAKELGQATMGCLWIGIFLAFLSFFYHYHIYYKLGVLQNNRSYYLS
jgi:hypothetical protein